MRRLFSRDGRPRKPRSALGKVFSAAVMACSIISCDSKPREIPPPPKPVPAAAPIKIDWKRNMRSLPPLEEDKPVKGPLCRDNMCKLAGKGKRYRKLAELISFRTRRYRTNRITYDEADRAAGYVLNDLRSMRNCRRLLRFLPETAVEILRGFHERGIGRKEAERMAYYLYRVVSWVQMRDRRGFDEYLTHLVGRDWKDVKRHPQEGFTWQSEKSFYAKHGVPDLKTALHLHLFLKAERHRKHFRKRFRFYGRHPPAP